MDYSIYLPLYNKGEEVLAKYQEAEQKLTTINPSGQPDLFKKTNKEYSKLSGVVEIYQNTKKIAENIVATKELLEENSQDSQLTEELTKELKTLEQNLETANEKLRRILIPKDPDDDKDVIMEIKAGSGGEESALFAGDLFRMYSKFIESKGWKLEIFDQNETGIGGYKNIEFSVTDPNPNPEDGVWKNLKYEGGVHRVQRVPVTESSGRIHTSAAGVYIYPQSEETEEIEIDDKDLRIDIFRSSGPGGQGVNTTDSAVRITHLPTGIVVSMQNERSQIQNKAVAMEILKSRLLAQKKEEEQQKASDQRFSQVRALDRSEKIRTYNFPENRIVDHRTGFKSYNLDKVLDGDLQELIDSAIKIDEESR